MSLTGQGIIAVNGPVALFITSGPVFADTLVVGTVYFDSAQILQEVIKLSAQGDNDGIAKLIENGHISKPTEDEIDIVTLATVTDEQRGRRPIFNATLRGAAGWLFFRVARSTRMTQIWALYRQSGSDRLEKQPADLRRHHHYMRDGALGRIRTVREKFSMPKRSSGKSTI